MFSILLWLFWSSALVRTTTAEAVDTTVQEEATGNSTCNPADAMHVVLLGETGVGKSTFGNYILGLNTTEGFPVGNGAESVTVKTESKLGHLLGKDDQPCLLITDTPGLGDTECRDEKHMKGIIETILKQKKVDLFVLVFRSNDNRFNAGIQRMIHLFEKLLGNSFYSSLAIEFTFFRHDARSRLIRSLSNISKELIADEWNSQLKTRYEIDEDIPTVFVDPKFVEEISDETEREIQENQVKLFKGALHSNNVYECKSHCMQQLNAWHKMLQPRITTGSLSVKRNTKVSMECSVWYQSYCKSNDVSNPELQWVLEANRTNITVNDLDDYYTESTTDEALPIYRSKIIFNISEETEGSYYCIYGSQESQKVSMVMALGPKVDGFWTGWSTWTECSWRNSTYTKQRHRHCILPQNRGLPCTGSDVEHEDCETPQEEIDRCFNPGYTWTFYNNLLDIVRDVKTVWDCRGKCSDMTNCKGFTWFDFDEEDPVNSLTCKLFSKLDKAIRSRGVSGKQSQCTCSVQQQCGINSKQVSMYQTQTERECQDMCTLMNNCEMYTWYDSTSYSRYHCYLYQTCEDGQPCHDCHSGHKTCNNFCSQSLNILDERQRNVNTKSSLGSDPNQFLSYRGYHTSTDKFYFSGAAGTRMPTYPPRPGSCGTEHPGWLNGTYPSIPGAQVTHKVCFVNYDDDCEWSTTTTVTNCGWGYQFALEKVPNSNGLTYCGM